MLKSESFHDDGTTIYALDQWSMTFKYHGHALPASYFIMLYSQYLCHGNFSPRVEGMSGGKLSGLLLL
jgi:hypothetical protein